MISRQTLVLCGQYLAWSFCLLLWSFGTSNRLELIKLLTFPLDLDARPPYHAPYRTGTPRTALRTVFRTIEYGTEYGTYQIRTKARASAFLAGQLCRSVLRAARQYDTIPNLIRNPGAITVQGFRHTFPHKLLLYPKNFYLNFGIVQRLGRREFTAITRWDAWATQLF